jgi:hypothetical protein
MDPSHALPASQTAQRANNPIRKIVDNLRKPDIPGKPLIPLSLGAWGRLSSPPLFRARFPFSSPPHALCARRRPPPPRASPPCAGDPTIFGNFRAPEVLVRTVEENLRCVHRGIPRETFGKMSPVAGPLPRAKTRTQAPAVRAGRAEKFIQTLSRGRRRAACRTARAAMG